MKPQGRVSRNASLSAPTGGWNARDAVANMPPLDAVIMDNVWPTTSDVMLRKGYLSFATFPGQGETILAYNGLTANDLFVVAAGSVYDITAGGPASAAVVTGLTNSRLQYVNVENSGGSFLIAVNGDDPPLLYNGSTWSNTAITGFSQDDSIQINLFKNRVWLVPKESLSVWYLAPEAIAGAATEFPLAAVATKGGYIMAMGTWTFDGGQGIDDYAAFITSQGEIIVYQGTDPDAAATWSLVGVWQVGYPIGRRCFLKFGGDMLLICLDGVQPMSKLLQAATIDVRQAITNKIQGAMSEAAANYQDNFGWQLDLCPKDNRVLLNVPAGEGVQMQFAMNTITGSWCRFTGLAANVWEQFEGNSYFAGEGFVGKFWDGFSDNTNIINGDVLQAFSTFGNAGVSKRWTLAQLFFLASGPPSILAAINVDYDPGPVSGSVIISNLAFGLWDIGLWDIALWGGALTTYKPYVGLTGVGKAAGMRLQIASDQLEIHWQATNFVFEDGGFL